VNSFIIYSELHGRAPCLQFMRRATQGLQTRGTAPTKNWGRQKQDTSRCTSTVNPHEKRKGRLSVSSEIRLQNRGGRWPEFVSKSQI
jgi:hypothetical protein